MAKLSPAELKGLKLTDAIVAQLQEPGDYLDGVGLALQVRSATSKSWLLKYQIANRPREMGLGSWKKIPLQLARELRKDHQQLIAQGIDPIELKKAKKLAKKIDAAKQITFRKAAERLIASKRKGWKNAKHTAQWASTLETYVFSIIGDLPVQSVDTGLVLKILNPIWSTKTETASRVRGRIEAVINSAKAYGEFSGENPARWKGNLDHILAKKSDVADEENMPALPYDHVPAFVQDLQAREGIAAEALLFQILTAGRPGNVRNARWSEIDIKAATWTINYRDMKKDREHKVPLSAAALAVMVRMEKIRAGEFVFFAGDGDKPLGEKATSALIDRMNGARERAGLAKWIDPTLEREIVPHGFRSSFRDWAGDETRHDSETAEFALAHVKGDKAEKAYRRKTSLAKRKALMDAWSAFVTRENSADVLAFAPIAAAN